MTDHRIQDQHEWSKAPWIRRVWWSFSVRSFNYHRHRYPQKILSAAVQDMKHGLLNVVNGLCGIARFVGTAVILILVLPLMCVLSVTVLPLMDLFWSILDPRKAELWSKRRGLWPEKPDGGGR